MFKTRDWIVLRFCRGSTSFPVKPSEIGGRRIRAVTKTCCRKKRTILEPSAPTDVLQFSDFQRVFIGLVCLSLAPATVRQQCATPPRGPSRSGAKNPSRPSKQSKNSAGCKLRKNKKKKMALRSKNLATGVVLRGTRGTSPSWQSTASPSYLSTNFV